MIDLTMSVNNLQSRYEVVEGMKCRIIGCLLLLFGVSLFAQPIPVHQDPPGYLGSGIEYYRGGDYATALTNFEIAIKKERKNPAGWYYAGLCHYQRHEYSEGIKFAQKSIHRDKTNSYSWQLKGMCEAGLNRWRKAEKSLIKSVAIGKENDLAWIELGEVKEERDKFVEAVSCYSTAIKLSPLSSDYYEKRAALNLRLGSAQGAINDSKLGLQFDSENQQLYLITARAFLIQKDSMPALRNFTSVIDLDSMNVVARLERSKISLGKGLVNEALMDLNQAIKINEECHDCLLARGVIYLKAGDNDKAFQDFMDLMALDMKDGKAGDELAAYYAGVTALMTGKLELGLFSADRAISIDHKSARAYWIRADIKKAMGDFKGAIKDRKKAGKRN